MATLTPDAHTKFTELYFTVMPTGKLTLQELPQAPRHWFTESGFVVHE